MGDNNEKNKRGPGRPRVEDRMTPEWYNIMIDAGREGKHITEYLITLGISWDTHHALLKRNKKYSEAFNEYNKLCEQWWFERAYDAMASGESNKFNQRLWTIIMKNKFKNNWQDENKVDITTKGDKLNPTDNTIQVEIIRKTLGDEGTQQG